MKTNVTAQVKDQPVVPGGREAVLCSAAELIPIVSTMLVYLLPQEEEEARAKVEKSNAAQRSHVWQEVKRGTKLVQLNSPARCRHHSLSLQGEKTCFCFIELHSKP